MVDPGSGGMSVQPGGLIVPRRRLLILVDVAMFAAAGWMGSTAGAQSQGQGKDPCQVIPSVTPTPTDATPTPPGTPAPAVTPRPTPTDGPPVEPPNPTGTPGPPDGPPNPPGGGG